MYIMKCDGHTLLDAREDAYILRNPKIKLEDNTVGSGSFQILENHPNYDKLKVLKSIFEVKDEFGVIFRGRMTEHTRDIYRGKAVELEGAMAFFNDSIVRPYKFPEDFSENAEYIAAASKTPEEAKLDGGVVRFLLKWYIDRHNEQVEPFQRFKLGNVTVYDKNNVIVRESSDYPNTWSEIKAKLFGSSLGGHLCIRYEADGNYIDYLAEFTETNSQKIIYGENLLDISQTANATNTYTAIIPRGKDDLTIDVEGLADGQISGHEDIVKRGDLLYSASAVASYGLRIAPTSETVWEDVTEPQNLLNNGVEFLEGDKTKIPETIECKAVDLHCTDAEIRSFRMYKKTLVNVAPHGIDNGYDTRSLDIDLLNPQNTTISAGKTIMTLTDLQEKQQKEVKNKVSSAIPSIDENGIVEITFESSGKPTLTLKFNTYDMYNQISAKLEGTDAAVAVIKEDLATTKTELSGAKNRLTTVEDTAANANGMALINKLDLQKTNGNLQTTNDNLQTTNDNVTKAILKADELVVDANNKKTAIEQNWADISNIKGKLDEVIIAVNAMGGSIAAPPPINTKPSIDVMVQIK